MAYNVERNVHLFLAAQELFMLAEHVPGMQVLDTKQEGKMESYDHR